jgi:hypothetical protein
LALTPKKKKFLNLFCFPHVSCMKEELYFFLRFFIYMWFLHAAVIRDRIFLASSKQPLCMQRESLICPRSRCMEPVRGGRVVFLLGRFLKMRMQLLIWQSANNTAPWPSHHNLGVYPIPPVYPTRRRPWPPLPCNH